MTQLLANFRHSTFLIANQLTYSVFKVFYAERSLLYFEKNKLFLKKNIKNWAVSKKMFTFTADLNVKNNNYGI